MCRVGRAMILSVAMGASTGLTPGAAGAQTKAPTKPATAPALPDRPPEAAPGADRTLSEADAAMEAYLGRPGLRPLLAEHLAQRLHGALPEEKQGLADRLGRLYVELIGAAQTPAERADWERLARELIRAVPETAAADLRLELARAVYLKAESAAERFRLRLATDAEIADARTTLADLKTQLEAIGAEIGRRADSLTRMEDSGRATEAQIAEAIEARRLRSVALYYAGWSACYLSLVNNATGPSAEALKNFTLVLTGAPGKSANLEKFQKELLKYDHLARAAIGTALAHAQAGNPAEGLRWLDLVEAEPALAADLRAQLLPRRIAVLAQAKRWADLERLIATARKLAPDTRRQGRAAASPLETTAARLLAVSAFEADRAGTGELVSGLAQTAVQDLIARGEVAQVLDLANRYGTSGLGEAGFIPHFVRGVQAYEQAAATERTAGHAGGDTTEPTRDPALAARFRQAAAALDGAATQPDAGAFTAERSRAKITAGRALFRAGDPAAAALRFAAASEAAPDAGQAEEALWLAIIAAERAARDQPAQAPLARQLEEFSTLYLRRFPQSERAATLLLRRVGRSALSDEEAVKVLLAVGRDTPIFSAAQRQAARLLYRAFRASDDADRAFAAGRFAQVAEEVLESDRREATRSDADGKPAPASPEQAAAVERGIAVARQLLDALLWGSTPDPARAEAVLETLNAMALHAGTDLAPFQGELTFRRVQVRLAKGDQAGAIELTAQLRGIDPSLADSADRLFYQRALVAYRRLPPIDSDTPAPEQVLARLDAARAVVVAGERLIAHAPPTVEALRDPALQTVYRQVAEAAAAVFRLGGDIASRDLAVRLDRLVLQAAPNNRSSLTRLAQLAEAAGEQAVALEAWTGLSASLPEGSAEWFEARFNAIRLLALGDAPGATVAINQLQVLYPTLGPEPWRTKLTEMRAKLPAAPPPPAPIPAPAAGGGGGGAAP